MNKKIYCILLFFLASSVLVKSQEIIQIKDPEAERILDRSSETINKLKSFQADFVLEITDRKENQKRTEKGQLLLSGNKYMLSTGSDEIYFNGKTMWSYNSDYNEVIITEPENNNDFFSNPVLLFSIYKNDFKYRYIEEISIEKNNFHEIDLFPEDLNQPYVRIKLLINTLNFYPGIIHMQGKDGVDYTISFLNIVTNKDVTDANFSFNTSSRSRTEVIDMRGVK